MNCRSAFGVVATALLATACVDRPPTATSAPGGRANVQLGIVAQVYASAVDRTIAIQASYRRASGESVALPTSPSEVTLASGTRDTRDVTIDIGPCLDDPQRVGASSGGCGFTIELMVLDANRTPLSHDTQAISATPGQHVDVSPFNLRAPGITLAPTQIAFGPVEEKSASPPPAQTVQITSNSGVPLPGLTASVRYTGAPAGVTAPAWLNSPTLQGSTAVSIQPNTTTLTPGRYTALVTASSSLTDIAPQSITVTYDVTAIPQFPLSVTGGGTGSGTVTSSPAGINCTITNGVASGTCTQNFTRGTAVTLTATPLTPGNAFTAFSAPCGTSPTCQVTVTAAQTVSATFTRINVPLTVQLAGAGSGTVVATAGTINCSNVGTGSSACSAQINQGTSVTLTATAGTGSGFGGWSGEVPTSCQSASSTTCTLTMDQARTVTATFTRITPPLTVRGAGSGSGSIQSDVGGITCTIAAGVASDACSGTFAFGQVVTLTATPAAGSTFDGWSGDVPALCQSASGTTCTLTMDQARTATATFTRIPPLLTVRGAGNGSGSIQSDVGGIACTIAAGAASGACSATFTFGQTVTLTALPISGSAFGGWAGDVPASCQSPRSTTCTLTIDQARTAVATFTRLPATLTVLGAGAGNGSVQSDVGGVTCTIAAGAASGTCSATYTFGQVVTLTASTGPGNTFGGWSGDVPASCQSASSIACTVTMDSPRTVTATFARITPPLTVRGAGAGSGSVQSNIGAISCSIAAGAASGACSATFDFAQTVTLTAAAATGSAFGGWSGDVPAACQSASSTTCTLTMDQARTAIATFNAAACTAAPAPLARNDFPVSGSVARTGGSSVDVLLNPIVIDGTPVTGLTASNFQVYEDNCVRDFTITSTSGSRGVDIVFIQDLSGSMNAEITGVRNSVISFAQSLTSRGINVRIGSIGYSGPTNLSDIASTPAGSRSEYLGPFQDLTDPTSFQTHVQNRWSVGGGEDAPENGLEAIEYANSHISWRSGAARVYILITDANVHTAADNCNGAGPCTDETVAKIVTLLNGTAAVHVIAKNPPDAGFTGDVGEDPRPLATATGGQRLDLPLNGNVDLNALGIADVISQVVRLTFQSATNSPATHDLRVRVTLNDGRAAEFSPGPQVYDRIDTSLIRPADGPGVRPPVTRPRVRP